jgi:serine/threonine protein kinase
MPDQLPKRPPRRIGEYELVEKVGQGGMSKVYKARDTRNGKIVAVKVASQTVSKDPHLNRRFEMEYALANTLVHPNLVRVEGFGKHDQTPFLVMDFVVGHSLAHHIAKNARLSEDEAIEILCPIIDAVDYLHKRKIIHRDIKPANILIANDGVPKLTDLGLGKDLESLSRLTRSNFGLGTLHFASPEQFDDARSADVRSDVYSLSATLYNAVTGDLPFGKGPTLSVVRRKLANEFDPPRNRIPTLSSTVDEAICRGLNADRKKRPDSVREWFSMLTAASPSSRVRRAPSKAVKEGPRPKITKKAIDERRSAPRYDVEMVGVCRPATGRLGQQWDCTIVDISAHGLCVRTQRRFEPNTPLEVSFFPRSGDSAITHLVRVKWHQSSQDKYWLLGCAFVNLMTEADLDLLFADMLDHTKMG